MYIYINKEGKITTQIEHGEPVRQGNALHLFVCFDADREELKTGYSLYAEFKNNDVENSSWQTGYVSNNPNSIIFNKIKSSEITFDLVDGNEYIVFDILTPSGDIVTKYAGRLSCVLTLYDVINDDNVIQDEIDINVAATYGSKLPTNNISQTDYNKLLAELGKKLDKYEGEGDTVTLNDSYLVGETTLKGTIVGSGSVSTIQQVKLRDISYSGAQSFQDANVFIKDATAYNMPVSKKQLDEHIDSVDARSDVVDVVGTYADLGRYNTASLTQNDIVKVLSDDEHIYSGGTTVAKGATTMYRWDGLHWNFIGAVGPYYTKAESNKNIDEAKSEVKDYTDEKVQALKEEMDNRADVVDVVGTYSELMNYDKTNLTDNDVIKVLQDEAHQYATTYYRYFTDTNDFVWIGTVGPYYTTTQSDERYLKKESAIIEEHEISEAFYERTTASDSTGSKYEIENGSLAKVKYLSGMSYKSENLLVFEDVEETVNNGITYSVKDGVITLNGTATQDVAIQLLFNGFNGNDVYLNTFTNDITREHHFALYTPQWETILFNFNNNTSGKVYINDGKFYRGISITIKSGDTVSNWTIKLMAVKGTTAPTEYKQGFEGLRNTAVTEIKSVGENLLNTDYLVKRQQVMNGVTINYDESNNTYTLNGTTTSTIYPKIIEDAKLLPFSKGTYTLKTFIVSGSISVASSNLVAAFMGSGNSMVTNFGNYLSSTTTIDTDYNLKMYLSIASGVVCNNLKIKVMVVKGSTAPTEYQPYWEETLKIPESVTSIEGYGDGLSKTDLSKTNYVDFERNKFVQNVNEIKLKDLTWRKSTTTTVDRFIAYLPSGVEAFQNAPHICDLKGITNAYGTQYSSNFSSRTQFYINLGDYGTTTLEDFVARLNEENPSLVYPLETPIETDIDLVDRTYKVDNLGTETLVNEYNQKAFASIEYGVSLKSQIIENSENIANLKLTTEQHEERINDLENEKLNKVSTVTSTAQVYAKDSKGNQNMVSINTGDGSNSIAWRDNTGNFKVRDLKDDSDGTYVANKNYVDNLKNIVNKQAQRIKQLELASEGTILSTYENVSEVSYNRLIGANVLPYGTLDKVGGMTYKSENLLNIDDFTTTKNGITYTYSKGHFTAKGTFEGVHQYNNVYFNSNQMAMMGKTKLYANKTYVLSISNAVSRKISMAHSGIAGTGDIEIGQTTKVFTTTKDIALNVIQIGGNTEEEIGTSIDLEFDIWINEGTTAKTFNVYYEGLRDSKVSEVISNGANLLGFEDIEETTLNGLTYSSKNGIIYLNGKTTANTYIKIPCKLIGVGTYTSKTLEYKENGVATDAFKLAIYFRDSSDKFIIAMYDNYRQTINITNALGAMELVFASGLAYNNVSFGISIVRGTTAPTEYKPYKAPIHYTVPPEVQALQGYGIGINETYNNYIDYDRKMFVQNVKEDSIDISNVGSVQKNDTSQVVQFIFKISDMKDAPRSNIICDKYISDIVGDKINVNGTYLNYLYLRIPYSYLSATPTTDAEAKTLVLEYFNSQGITSINVIYPLATPVETDISQYLTEDNVIEMEANGSLTFENEHQQAVPNEITYQERNV